MSELLLQILDTPQAPLILQKVQAILDEERHKRRAFYEWLDEDKKAEFINGEVVVHSPALDRHNSAMLLLARLLSIYVDDHQLGYVRAEKALVELTRNSYEPDICYFGSAKAAQIMPDQLYYPAPDLVVEVLSKSTEKIDREIKFADYAAHGIAEYWIVDPLRRTIEQYGIDDDTLEYALAGTFGLKDTISSYAVAGFAIPVRAVFDEAANILALRNLLTS
ncbi:Uma2 family endonuclease [Spirosoma panaciterrae]|uniref:Uma2 family endonuclease n=1 Tax=Spirosoma panaciterrae TaxID=496058 RepID=UPI000371910E|nr:Uma2 family endonuclease [Spirosoma panaciterrae]